MTPTPQDRAPVRQEHRDRAGALAELLYVEQMRDQSSAHGHFVAAMAQALADAAAEERERAAKVAEGGRFLHDDAPDARFGKACAAAIREAARD